MNSVLLVAIAVLASAFVIISADATPPSPLCDYACLWPIGSYSVPETATVGEEHVITYTYAWHEIPENIKVGALDQKEIPPGYHTSGDLGEMPTPSVYKGSTVRLQLPEGIDVISWSGGELERQTLWVDHYGRTTYGYFGLNKYLAEGATTSTITLRFRDDAIVYPNDRIYVDLGVRGDAWRSPVMFANMEGDTIKLSDEAVSGATGAAPGLFSLRGTHVMPDSAVRPLDDDVVEETIAQAMRSLAMGQDGTAGDFSYAYGMILAQDRPPFGIGVGVNTQAFSGAADVKVCAHDVGGSRHMVKVEPMTVNGEPACSTVDAEGFFGIVVPRVDPDGDGTPADIVPLFSLEHEKVTVRDTVDSIIATRGSGPVSASGLTVPLGKYTVPEDALFTVARWMYADTLDAHEFFSDTFRYDAPHVNVNSHVRTSYNLEEGHINVIMQPVGTPQAETNTQREGVLHEYGHHVMYSVYSSGIPPLGADCFAHYPGLLTNSACAWAEGWAEFVSIAIEDNPVRLFGTAARNAHHNYETRETHNRPEGATHDPLSGSLVLTQFGDGWTDEGNITASLWDMHDEGSEEAGDNMSGGLPEIWAAFTASAEGEPYNARHIYDFWADWVDVRNANPAEVFALNTIGDELSHPATLGAHVERGGERKDGAGARHARVGDVIVARLETGGRIGASSAPEAAILGGDTAPMVPDGAGAWAARATVAQGAHDGVAPITVRGDSPRIRMAASDPITHEEDSGTVTIRTAYEPAVGAHGVVVGTTIADLGGTAVATETTRKFTHYRGAPVLLESALSPDGTGVTLHFDRGLDDSTVTLQNIRLDSRLTLADDPVSHEDGLDIVHVALSSHPTADGMYSVHVASVADTQGRPMAVRATESLGWNPRPPVLESAKLTADGNAITLMFSEKVERHDLRFGRSFSPHVPLGVPLFTDGPSVTDAPALRLRNPPLNPGTYLIRLDNIGDENDNSIRAQVIALTHTTRDVPVIERASPSSDGTEITLTFNRGVSSTEFSNRSVKLSRGSSNLLFPPGEIISSDRLSHTPGSDTVKISVPSRLQDGFYLVRWNAINALQYREYESSQIQYFFYNPEAPRVVSHAVSPDGRSVSFTFSEEMDEASFERHIRVPDTVLVDRDNVVTKAPGSRTITLNLAAPLREGTYQITLNRQITDAASLGLATDYVALLRWDAARPSLESAEMSADGMSVRLTFSEGLDGSTVTAESISPSAGLSLAADAIGHVDGSSTVTLNLASAPAAGQHTVTAKGTIRDSTGVPMETDHDVALRHVPGAPVFESASLSADGSTVTLEFSEGLDASTVTAGSVYFAASSERLLFAQDGGLAPVVVDTTPPGLLDAFFTSASSIRLELSEPPNPATVTVAAFELRAGGSPVPFTVLPHTPGEATVTLSLGSGASNAAHTVSVRGSLTDRAGNPAAESSRTIATQAAENDAPTFTAKRANGVMVIVEFSEAMRVTHGREPHPRDWLAGPLRPTNHHLDLDNRRIVLQFDARPDTPALGLGEVSYKPLSGLSALEDHTGYDLPVGSSASTATPRGDFPFFFAESTAEGVINVRFDRTVSETPSAFRIGGTTAASEWTVNGAPATGVRAGATGEAASSITLGSAAGFYLTHDTAGAPESLQVKYTRPAGGGNSLSNADGTLGTTQVTSVNRIMNAFTGGEFADARTLELTSTRPADRRVADHLVVAATGDAPPATLASGSRSPGNPLVEVLRLGAGARDGCTYRVSLMPPVDSAMGIWTPGGGSQGEVTYTDAHAPVILSASTDGTVTSVLFDEPVSLGASPTLPQHRGHWTVTERVGGADVARAISDVAVSTADPATVKITHAALSGTAATPTISYDGTPDDDARIRDTRASPCTEADATPKNEQAGMLEATASDGAAPAGEPSASVSRGGVPKAGPNALWARAGDTVTVSLAMAEDPRAGAAPRLTAAGENTPMEMGASAREWSGSRTVAAGASQGDYAFTVTALDAGANLGVFTQAGAQARAMVDTVLPRIDSAETAGVGEVRVTLSEGAWGLLRAADWTVGGERAAGASLAGGGSSPAVALAGETSFTLHVPGPGSTGETPTVVYSPQAPGASPGTAPAPDPPPGPPPAGITLDVGRLDGATVRMGESRGFPIAATAAGAQPIVLLEGNPGFVTVLNTGPGAATVTVDASRAPAAAGDYTFTVIAATGSDPARMEVTVTLVPAA